MGYNFIGQARLAWLNSVLMMITLLAAPIAACLINLMNRKGRRRCHRCHMQLQLATASAIDSNNIAITAAQSKLWTGSNCRSYRSIYAQLNAALTPFAPSLSPWLANGHWLWAALIALRQLDSIYTLISINWIFDFDSLDFSSPLSPSLTLSFSCFVHCAGLSLVH